MCGDATCRRSKPVWTSPWPPSSSPETNGLANVRIPQMAAAVGVSPGRSTTTSGARKQRSCGHRHCELAASAENLAGRPPAEPLSAAPSSPPIAGLYGETGDGRPPGRLASASSERSSLPNQDRRRVSQGRCGCRTRILAEAISGRTGSGGRTSSRPGAGRGRHRSGTRGRLVLGSTRAFKVRAFWSTSSATPCPWPCGG